MSFYSPSPFPPYIQPGWTFPAIAGFQESGFLSESNGNGPEMHFECNIGRPSGQNATFAFQGVRGAGGVGGRGRRTSFVDCIFYFLKLPFV